jgi:Lon protease-like protein
MFPLGSVLIPGTPLPLRVFEPRYQALVDVTIETGDPFGIVLIERGFEVGGGDQRFGVGTFAHLLGVGDLDGGHRGIVVRGGGRFEVTTWLTDDPYPRAEVEPLDEPPGFSPDIDGAEASVRQALALLSELGHDLGLDQLEVPEEPVAASWALAALCPVGPLDAQELLEAGDAAIRLQLIKEFADDQSALSRMRLAGG